MFVCHACLKVMKEQKGKALPTTLSLDVIGFLQETFPELKNMKVARIEIEKGNIKIHGTVPEHYDLDSFTDKMAYEFS